MAAVGAFLMGQVMGKSKEEATFRPLWDTLEDYCIYGLVTIGVVLVPMAIVAGTPLECNFCRENYCNKTLVDGTTKTYENKLDDGSDMTNPDFRAWWIKNYCTYNGAEDDRTQPAIDNFLLNYPYFLLLNALLLFASERIFVAFAGPAGLKQKKLFDLIYKEGILGAGGESEGKEKVIGGGSLEAVELKYGFQVRNSYFKNYLQRTVVQLLVSVVMLSYMVFRGHNILEANKDIICNVHDYWYECDGTPTQFYLYSLRISMTLTFIYLLLQIYNIVWLLVPDIGELSRVMSSYKKCLRNQNKDQNINDEDLLGDLWYVYYNNRDLKLLLELLVSTSGVAPAISILCVFDKEFRNAMKPEGVSVTVANGVAEIKFLEPTTGRRAALLDFNGVHMMYVAELDPPAETCVEIFESRFVPELHRQNSAPSEKVKGFIQQARFEGLQKDTPYKIKVNTVVNGKTICQIIENVKTDLGNMGSNDDENDQGKGINAVANVVTKK